MSYNKFLTVGKNCGQRIENYELLSFRSLDELGHLITSLESENATFREFSRYFWQCVIFCGVCLIAFRFLQNLHRVTNLLFNIFRAVIKVAVHDSQNWHIPNNSILLKIVASPHVTIANVISIKHNVIIRVLFRHREKSYG